MKKVLLFAFGCMLAFSVQANTTKDDVAQNSTQEVNGQSGKYTVTIYVRNSRADGKVVATADTPVYSNIGVSGVAWTRLFGCNEPSGAEYVEYVEGFSFLIPAGSTEGEIDLPLMCGQPQRITHLTGVSLTIASDAYANYVVMFH